MRSSFDLLIAVLVAGGVLAVALLDHATGAAVQVLPLYFLPLILAAWHFRRATGVFTAIGITTIWAMMQYDGGTAASGGTWFLNFLIQAGAFTVLALLVDMLRTALQRERDLSRTDPLTGLANSRSFFERAGGVLAMCHRDMQPATLAYIDLDNFKHVNDTLGHARGDALLRSVTRALAGSLRASDVCARMGGDEFVVLLPNTSRETAYHALEKVRRNVNERADLHGNGVTVSIGAVTWASAPSDIAPMIKAADKLMYRVKAASKNRVIVQSMEQVLQDEYEAEADEPLALRLPAGSGGDSRSQPPAH